MILRPITGLTPEELRSHLKILHGIYTETTLSLAEYVECHDTAHADSAAGRPIGPEIPHEHVEPPLFDTGAAFEW